MQMSGNALQIEASGNRHMMQMRFGQPSVGCAPQARRAHGLRDGPFDASPQGVALDKGGRALLGTPLHEGRMHVWGRECERTTFLSTGTLLTPPTAAARGRRKADHHRGVPAAILRVGPAHTLVPLWTGGDLSARAAECGLDPAAGSTRAPHRGDPLCDGHLPLLCGA